MTKNVQDLLKELNILVSFVPNNMTHLFQSLDLTVNSWAKRFMKEEFTMWYASKVKESLDHGVAIDDIDIMAPLILIKPLHAKWIIDMYDQLTSEKGKEIVMSERVESFWNPKRCTKRNESYESDSEDEYVLDKENFEDVIFSLVILFVE